MLKYFTLLVVVLIGVFPSSGVYQMGVTWGGAVLHRGAELPEVLALEELLGPWVQLGHVVPVVWSYFNFAA
jgi:hypothetical protein